MDNGALLKQGNNSIFFYNTKEVKMKGKLVLEDGQVFQGILHGAVQQGQVGEVVFNTSMTGYQEILTDPSYFGQIVVMTYPLIGNYGVNDFINQSSNIQVKGIVVKELSDIYTHWESTKSLDEFLKEQNIVLIEGVDTRRLTKVIRDSQSMNGKIVTSPVTFKDCADELNDYCIKQPVYSVTTTQDYIIKGENINGKKIAVIDFGIKSNILKQLKKKSKELKVFKANFKPENIRQYNPDGLFLSNGPGDPQELKIILENLGELVENYPTFGICLGHQLIALLYGLKTRKMAFGHRGANHPVISTETNKVFISAQNHGYEVVGSNPLVKVLYKNINDGSIEGLKVINKPIFSVQFHPEASPGPKDSLVLFDEFFSVLEGC